MKTKAMNCPNCGAAIADDSVKCGHCQSRLKTMSCTSCFGTIFMGSRFCPLCGAQAVGSKTIESTEAGDCPRCKKKLTVLKVEDVVLQECEECEGIWADMETFENICASKEDQAAILQSLDKILTHKKPERIQYVPCPECGQLMNRSNFARVSGVILDICKSHGAWFDAYELPGIIEFIHKGGLDYARQKEKAQIDDEKSRLREERYKLAVDRFKSNSPGTFSSSGSGTAIRDFIEFLLD